MRRHETPLDPAVAAELDALEAALAGDPAAEPELAMLVRDVRLEAPAMTPVFRAQLDERVASRFAGASKPRDRSGRFAALRGRPLIPALGIAGCLLAALVAVLVATGGGKDDAASRSGAGGGSVAATQAAPAQRESSGSAGSGAAPNADSAAPSASKSVSPAAPPASGGRHVERSTQLQLTTTDVQKTADGVVRATQAAGGYVQLSQVRTGDGNGSATFVLRVPTAKLDEAIASLSKLGHVSSMQQSANDITGQYDSAQSRLADARAERRGLLRALAKATTAQEIASLKARIADNRAQLNRLQSEFNAVRRRATYATIEVDVVGKPHKQQPAPASSWDPGDAAHDALRVLEVGAGVALVGLSVLVPLALIGGAAAFAAGAWRRRRREAALDAAAEPI
jgi:Domain of unknown function (DUF4349)